MNRVVELTIVSRTTNLTAGKHDFAGMALADAIDKPTDQVSDLVPNFPNMAISGTVSAWTDDAVDDNDITIYPPPPEFQDLDISLPDCALVSKGAIPWPP